MGKGKNQYTPMGREKWEQELTIKEHTKIFWGDENDLHFYWDIFEVYMYICNLIFVSSLQGNDSIFVSIVK